MSDRPKSGYESHIAAIVAVLACVLLAASLGGLWVATHPSSKLARKADVAAAVRDVAGKQNLRKLAVAEVAKQAQSAGVTVTKIRVVRVTLKGTDASVYVGVDTVEVGHVNLVVVLSKSNWSVSGVHAG